MSHDQIQFKPHGLIFMLLDPILKNKISRFITCNLFAPINFRCKHLFILNSSILINLIKTHNYLYILESSSFQKEKCFNVQKLLDSHLMLTILIFIGNNLLRKNP